MAVRIVDEGPARGHPGRGAVTDAVAHDANNLIGDLSFGEIKGNVGTIATRSTCRIDRQRPPAGGTNLQVQLNAHRGDSTIATCVVDGTVFESMSDWPPGLRAHQEAWILRQVRVALHRSCRKERAFRLIGSFQDADTPSNLTPREGGHYRRHRPHDPA